MVCLGVQNRNSVRRKVWDKEIKNSGASRAGCASSNARLLLSSEKLRFVEGGGSWPRPRLDYSGATRRTLRAPKSDINLQVDLLMGSFCFCGDTESQFDGGNKLRMPPSAKRSFPKDMHCQTLSLATRRETRETASMFGKSGPLHTIQGECTSPPNNRPLGN